ncbi:MAG: hypothetical protein IK149_04060 [Oscillospiraceae bacterium]|nr:hypothetical protein [Oscillospiraceae bacterium]
MKAFRRFLLWYGLFSKRLLRRPAYLAVLLLVPLFAVALTLFSQQKSGVLTVALALEDPRDPAASAAVERLTRGDSILLCELAESPEAAREAVRSGRADAAWIFSDDFEAALQHFAARGYADAVTVVEREDNVLLMLSRELLFAAIYPETSFELFSYYVETEIGLEDAEPALLRQYYASGTIAEQVVRFETVEGKEADGSGSYLTAPLRGILALLLVLCGMASGLYCYREERSGSFVWLSARKRRWLPLLSHLTAILPAALAALAAMALAGITVEPGREALMLLLYVPATALFCELLRCLCPAEAHYGALIPVLTAAMLVLCPVFLDLNLLGPLRLLLPPTWYLRAVWNGAELLGLLLYTLALLLLTALASFLRQRRRGY